jgi:hypothetical protein
MPIPFWQNLKMPDYKIFTHLPRPPQL